eukprot:332695-Chlamydomonas_euryale.AAC.1
MLRYKAKEEREFAPREDPGVLNTKVLCELVLRALKAGSYVGLTLAWTDGWTDGWMDGWMDGWTDGWTDERVDG